MDLGLEAQEADRTCNLKNMKKKKKNVVVLVDVASHYLYGYVINSNKTQQKINKRQVIFRYLTR